MRLCACLRSNDVDIIDVSKKYDEHGDLLVSGHAIKLAIVNTVLIIYVVKALSSLGLMFQFRLFYYVLV